MDLAQEYIEAMQAADEVASEVERAQKRLEAMRRKQYGLQDRLAIQVVRQAFLDYPEESWSRMGMITHCLTTRDGAMAGKDAIDYALAALEDDGFVESRWDEASSCQRYEVAAYDE